MREQTTQNFTELSELNSMYTQYIAETKGKHAAEVILTGRRTWTLRQHTMDTNLRYRKHYEMNFLQGVKQARWWQVRPAKA